MAYGEFFFAWVDPDEVFGPEHVRWDEEVFSYAREQREGEFCTLTLVIENPRVGLLSPDRKQWCMFGCDFGDGPELMFRGRLIGQPENSQDELIQVAFQAKPLDFEEQKADLAETLKVAPYWDPIWIDPDRIDDPDAALDARPARFHCDPVTHEVTISDNIAGEDGTLVFTAEDIFYEPTRQSFSAPPVRSVEMKATVRWTQQAKGEIDITQNLCAAFGHSYYIWSYSAGGLVADWPLPGDDIGRGWTLVDSDVLPGAGAFVSRSYQLSQAVGAFVGSLSAIARTLGEPTEPTASFSVEFVPGYIRPTMVVGYDVKRAYSEVVTFTLSADMQDVVTEAPADAIKRVSLASNDVSEPVDPGGTGGGEIPIVDVRRRSYMKTDRGHRSLEYLLAYARAHLLDGARAVQLSEMVPFDFAPTLSTRSNAQFQDPRFSGADPVGKIVAWRDSGDGDSGDFVCTVTIGCAVGKGNAVSASSGQPAYVEDGYVEDGWQARTDVQVLVAGDVTYDSFDEIVPNDDGVDFLTINAASAIEEIIVTNPPQSQRNLLKGVYTDTAEAQADLAAAATRICLHMNPVDGGPFETAFPITVSDLMVPRQIDLEATGSA